ncbi:reverse transcriptase domain-containing protein [Tanacetum coccineum]|uniref:Reverse transcriptase domain-containing protein n=1 Tax=Tanacetum coccineum TaxID=301880 RepID=A0ABQ5AR02_9ASTR
MGDENPIRTLRDYFKPSHEGYRNTIELPVGNNVVPLRSDTIQLVQNGCSFYRLRSEDMNQRLKDFLKLVDLLDLDGKNRERTRLRLFQSSLRDQASNWLERLPARSISTWEDLTTRFLTQFFLPGRTAKLHNDILIRTIDQSAGGKLRDFNAEESWALLEDLALYDNESWNDPRDFAKPVKAINLPQEVPSTSDRRLIKLENQYCMEDPEQAFVEYASSDTDEARAKKLDMKGVRVWRWFRLVWSDKEVTRSLGGQVGDARVMEVLGWLLSKVMVMQGRWCITRSSTNELFTPFKDPKREFRSSRKHLKTLSLDELRSPDFNLFSDQENLEEEVAETMKQYMSKTRAGYGSGVARPKIEDNDNFELKGQFLKDLRTNTFSGSDHEDANEHIEKVLEIVDLFHIPNITIDQVMLRAFPMSLTGAASRWLRNEPTGSITTWDGLKTKFLNKYCPPARTAKKIEEINNFQQEPDENLYQAWERFKELLMKCPQHYLTEMQEVILFYNGLGIPTRQILDSRGAIPSKTAADAKVAIQEMAEYSQKWHNGTSRSRSTKTSDGLTSIQAQLNNLGREIKKVNEKVYAAQVRCEQCKGPYYTKDYPLKEEGKTLEEAYYT